MATIEVKIPSVGESVQEAVLGEWFKQNGDMVEKDEALFVIETDKVTLEVTAEAAGILTILVQAGETVAVGTVVARIEIGAEKAAEAPAKAAKLVFGRKGKPCYVRRGETNAQGIQARLARVVGEGNYLVEDAPGK